MKAMKGFQKLMGGDEGWQSRRRKKVSWQKFEIKQTKRKKKKKKEKHNRLQKRKRERKKVRKKKHKWYVKRH